MNRPICNRLIPALAALLLLISAARAETTNGFRVAAPLAFLPPDAQGAAMGEATTALSRGPEAAWWNPAALALGRGLRGIPYSRSDRLLPGNKARLEHFAAAWGGGGIGIGATWIRWSPSGGSLPDSVSVEPLSNDPRNRQQVATVGIGIDLSRLAIALPRAARFALGATARGYREECRFGSTIGADTSGSDLSTRRQGWDLDGAALLTWRLAEPSRPDEEQGTPGATWDLCFGYVAMNALALEQESCDGRVSLGRRDRAGGALVLRLPVRWPYVRRVNLAAAFERRGLFLRSGEADRASDHLGGEISLGGIVAARVGRVRDPMPASAATRESWTTWGVGLRSSPAGGRLRRPGFAVDFANLGRRIDGDPAASQVTVSIWFR